MLNKAFRDEGVEKYGPWAIRHRAVARFDARFDQSTHCACYLCFRIKPIAKFQWPSSMATHARVIQRDEYTGERIFEVVSEPSPGQTTNIVQPPSQPVSPAGVGMGMAWMAIGPGGNIGSSTTGITAAVGRPANVRRPSHGWTPQAPGAEVGQIESLRTYCIPCALKSRLLITGDVLETREGVKQWVCACQLAYDQVQERCPQCGMSQVYRNAA